jgi:hypothetical protein
VKRVLLEARQDLKLEKIDCLPCISGFIMHKFAPLPNRLTPTLDASETVGFIPELCEESHVNIVCIDAFLEEKANNHSLLEVHVR